MLGADASSQGAVGAAKWPGLLGVGMLAHSSRSHSGGRCGYCECSFGKTFSGFRKTLVQKS